MDEFCYDVGMLLTPDNVEKVNGFNIDFHWQNTVCGGTRLGFVSAPVLVDGSLGDSSKLSFTGSAVVL